MCAKDRAYESEPIRLALCFAAIEAMVCNKTDGITEQLTRNIAALMQHDSNERGATITCVRKLYNARSKIIHGDRLEAAKSLSDQARLLAAGVLISIFDWLDFTAKIGDENKPVPDFFLEMEAAKSAGKRFVGVSDEAPGWLPD